MSCKQSKRPSSSSATGTAMTSSNKKAKQSPITAAPVWLVFVEEDTGSGSHSAELVGVYPSKNEADKHAESLREEDEDDSDEDADDESTSRSVTVVEAPVQQSFHAKHTKDLSIWRFEACM